MYNKKMSQVAIIGLLGLCVMCSSSSVAMLMMGDEETSNTTGPSSTGPSSTGPSSTGGANITNILSTDEYGFTAYEGCSGDGDVTNDGRFTQKIEGGVLSLNGLKELKGVGHPEIGSMVVRNMSIKGSYKIGQKDYTIDEGVGNKLIKFCQDDGTKATKYDFVMEF